LEDKALEVNRLCFVCLGNIVRSPLAENLFLHLAREQGVANKYEVDSAGTSAWHAGETPDPRMQRTAAQHGLHYDGRARQFKREDFDRFDLILAMDRENLKDLLSLTRGPADREKIHLLGEFDPTSKETLAVPDPYYGGIGDFIETYQVIERSCRGLLDKLEEECHESS
jgi:protein-tyrosine phosphatase